MHQDVTLLSSFWVRILFGVSWQIENTIFNHVCLEQHNISTCYCKIKIVLQKANKRKEVSHPAKLMDTNILRPVCTERKRNKIVKTNYFQCHLSTPTHLSVHPFLKQFIPPHGNWICCLLYQLRDNRLESRTSILFILKWTTVTK